MHNKIKQVDTYEKVWQNIQKYAAAAKRKEMLYTKYIVLKDVNDNERAVYDFLKKSKDSGVKYILMEIDHYYFCENRDNIPKYIIDLFYYAYNKSLELGLVCEIYSNSSVLLLQGKWADDFWKDKVFDAGVEIDKYSLRSVCKVSKDMTIKKYDDIKAAAASTGLTYKQIWKACEKSHGNKKFKIKKSCWFYADDIEIKVSQNKIDIDDNERTSV